MAHPFVSELSEGDALSARFVALDVQLRPFRDASKKGGYLALNLGDRTGSVPARVWDSADVIAKGFREGDVIYVEGQVEVYRGSLQAILRSIEPIAEGDYDPADFLPASPHNPETMLAAARRVVGDNLKSPYLRQLVDRYLASDDITPRLIRCPAAKALHHAYLGGLIEHIVGCLYIAVNVCKVHKSLDSDLLFAGIVLHDIGKVLELEATTHIAYTVPGQLVGHVVLGYEWVMREADAIEGFPEETKRQLGHIILSHHGQHEYGAPVLPLTPEAVAVHFIENTDAQANRALSAVAVARDEGADFTAYDRTLGRSFYARQRDDRE